MRPDSPALGSIGHIGARALGAIEYVGGMWLLLVGTMRWTVRGLFTRKGRFSWSALASQVVRLGIRSTAVVIVVQFFVGVILALQMAPPLKPFGSMPMIANIIGVAVFRELGPLISAVVLSGFAGASIAAEIGAMAVSEEIEALRAHAISPIRFLVVPRVLGTVVAMLGLCVIADLAGALGGYASSRLVLGGEAYQGYWGRIAEQLGMFDFVTGLIKAGVFGLIISLLACHEGLKVSGGAQGVGRATTMTVVYTIFSLIFVDCIFTIIFYVYQW
ncbi:MAG: ABC transporter permease [Planctomycetes bacterium]|nr:ABC transporter permease [Planctomycetota bacterium]